MNNEIQPNPISAVKEKTEFEQIMDITKVLLEKRDILIKQLKSLDEEISKLQEEYSAKLERLHAKKKPAEESLHHVEALLKLEGWPLVNNSNIRIDTIITLANNTISATDAAYTLLNEYQQPLHYKEMADKLQERHIYIPGKDPAATLLSKITRDKRFIRTRKRGIYTLLSWKEHPVKSKSQKTIKRKRAKKH